MGSSPAPGGIRARTSRRRGRSTTGWGQGTAGLAASALAGGGPRGKERLEAFVDRGGYVVITGQQPGLFGGPLYALYKGFTAAALARRLEAVTGRPVLPVFWVASEDHDWNEVRATHVLDVRNRLQEVAIPKRGPGPGNSIHRLRAGVEMAEALGRLLTHMPETDFLPKWQPPPRGSVPAGEHAL